MLKRIGMLWKDRRGEGYVDVIVLVLCAVLVIALAVRVLPVYIAKHRLDTFATELVRERGSNREYRGRNRPACGGIKGENRHRSGDCLVSGRRSSSNEEVTVTLTLHQEIGLFGNFGSFPILLRSQAVRQIGSILEVRRRPLTEKIKRIFKGPKGTSFHW